MASHFASTLQPPLRTAALAGGRGVNSASHLPSHFTVAPAFAVSPGATALAGAGALRDDRARLRGAGALAGAFARSVGLRAGAGADASLGFARAFALALAIDARRFDRGGARALALGLTLTFALDRDAAFGEVHPALALDLELAALARGGRRLDVARGRAAALGSAVGLRGDRRRALQPPRM